MFHFPLIWLVYVNKPWNMIGCCVLIEVSNRLGKRCDLEQKWWNLWMSCTNVSKDHQQFQNVCNKAWNRNLLHPWKLLISISSSQLVKPKRIPWAKLRSEQEEKEAARWAGIIINLMILTPWMACTVSNLIFNVLPLLTQGQGQFCKFWKMFFNQIYGLGLK